jgi:hypothetical protein
MVSFVLSLCLAATGEHSSKGCFRARGWS